MLVDPFHERVLDLGEVLNGPCRLTTSVLNSLMIDSSNALSYASPTDPIDTKSPVRSKRFGEFPEVY